MILMIVINVIVTIISLRNYSSSCVKGSESYLQAQDVIIHECNGI